MQERFKYTDRMVITFVALGLSLLVGFSALVLIKNKTLADKTYYQTILDHASGLSSKPPIFFKGFEIGRIDDFELESETNNILVKFYIYDNYTDKIIKYAVISRIESLVLGAGSQYELLLPQQGLIAELEPLREGELVPFITSELGRIYAKKGRWPLSASGRRPLSMRRCGGPKKVRAMIRDEVAETVEDSADVDHELGELRRHLSLGSAARPD